MRGAFIVFNCLSKLSGSSDSNASFMPVSTRIFLLPVCIRNERTGIFTLSSLLSNKPCVCGLKPVFPLYAREGATITSPVCNICIFINNHTLNLFLVVSNTIIQNIIPKVKLNIIFGC